MDNTVEWSYYQEMAKVMANVLEANLDGEDNLTEKGWFELHDIFGEIPPDRRAEAFVKFLEELARREIIFDVAQFQG